MNVIQTILLFCLLWCLILLLIPHVPAESCLFPLVLGLFITKCIEYLTPYDDDDDDTGEDC